MFYHAHRGCKLQQGNIKYSCTEKSQKDLKFYAEPTIFLRKAHVYSLDFLEGIEVKKLI